MRLIKNIQTQFAQAILLLVAIYTSVNVTAQTYNDGAMNIKMAVGYSYVNSIAFPNELNNYEFRWRWWGADNANLDGLGWVGGSTIGVNTQNVGWINPQDVNLLNFTYGTIGSTPQAVPQYLQLQGEGWEDDCFDCYRSTGTFTWACDQCSDYTNDQGCGCSTNILCGCSAEDNECGPQTISSTVNYRVVAPCLGLFSPPTVGNGWVGDYFSTGCGTGDIGAEVLASWTPPIPDPVVSTANVLCQPGLATLQTNGAVFGGDYHWYNNATNTLVGTGSQITPFVGTTTTYRVHTANGACESLSYRLFTVTVGQPNILSVSTVNPVCYGSSTGSLTVNATGGNGALEYSNNGGATWQSSNSFSNLPAGFYNIWVKDASGCTVIYAGNSVILTQPNPVNIFVNKVDPSCNATSTGRIDIFAGGGSGNLSYSIDNGTTYQPSSLFANLPAGSYNIVVKDAANCPYPFLGNPVVLTEPAPVSGTTTSTNASCANTINGSIQVTAAGGTSPYQYSLNNGPFFPNSIFTAVGPGNYTVLISDVNGCTASVPASVAASYSIAAQVVGQTDVSCHGGADGSVTVSATGGLEPYQFSIDGTIWQLDSTFVGLSGGIYTVIAKDANGCTDNVTATIIERPQLITSVISVSDVTCPGDSTGAITISTTGGNGVYSYLWSNSSVSQNLTNVGAGTYSVVVTDGAGCTASANATVASPPGLISSIAGNDPDCHGKATGFAVVTAGGGTPPYAYVWGTTPAQSGIMGVHLSGDVTYTVTITDSKGCTLTDQVTLVEPTQVVVTTIPNQVKCFNGNDGTVLVSATGGSGSYQYSLNNVYQQDSILTGLVAGEYTAIAQDNHGCFGAQNFTISQPAAIYVNAGPDLISVRGQTVTLNGTATSPKGIVGYVWSPDYNLSCTACQNTNATPDTTFMYYLTATDGDSCSNYDSVVVTVKNKVEYFIPTAFSPNADGLNDYFEVNVLGANTIQVTIFDRWGEQVYYNAAQHNGILNNGDAWDGKKGGKALPYDTYVYQLKVLFFNNTTEDRSGTITIVR